MDPTSPDPAYRELAEMGIAAPEPVTAKTKSISLEIPDVGVRIAGESVQGAVAVDLARAEEEKIEKIEVQFLGWATTKIKRTGIVSSDGNYHYQKFRFDRRTIPLWSKSSQSRALRSRPDSLRDETQIISIPFSIPIPSSLPPSFKLAKVEGSGRVEYLIEAIAHQRLESPTEPSIFNGNVSEVIKVMPKGSTNIVELRSLLRRKGWTGKWRHYIRERSIRPSAFGKPGNVKAVISLPDVKQFPISTPIPYILTVTTWTKPYLISPKHFQYPPLPNPYNPDATDVVFPCPNASSSGFSLRIDRHVDLYVRSSLQTGFESTTYNYFNKSIEIYGEELDFEGRKMRKGRGSGHHGTSSSVGHIQNILQSNGKAEKKKQPSKNKIDSINIETLQPEWTLSGSEAESGSKKSDKGKGCWKRQVTFKGTFTMREMPSFTMKTITCTHSLRVHIPFAGSGNNIAIAIPIDFASGFSSRSEYQRVESSSSPIPITLPLDSERSMYPESGGEAEYLADAADTIERDDSSSNQSGRAPLVSPPLGRPSSLSSNSANFIEFFDNGDDSSNADSDDYNPGVGSSRDLSAFGSSTNLDVLEELEVVPSMVNQEIVGPPRLPDLTNLGTLNLDEDWMVPPSLNE